MNSISLTNFIKKHNLIKKNSCIVIGLSGGPDSVFLLHFLQSIQKEYGLKLIAAHLDHEWRLNSAHDVLFCAHLCEQLNISFVSKKASELSFIPKDNGSQESLGRTLRRFYLESVCKENNADAIALAHHKDDQQETFFIRLIRGATLSGLASIKPKNGFYIRPLLTMSKNDILAYLHNHAHKYLTDSTNNSDLYLRNRIRTSVIPTLVNADKRFDATIIRTIESLQEAETFLTELTAATFNTLAILRDTSYYISISHLLSLHNFLQHRIIIHWLIVQQASFVPTQALVHEIIRFLHNNKSNHHALSSSWTLVKKKDNAFIIKN